MALTPSSRDKSSKSPTHQVVDTGLHVVVRWLPEIFNFKYLSTIHTRSALGKLTLAVGDILRDNEEEPMLTLLEDACGCVHCMLFAACDKYRHRQLGAAGHGAAGTILRWK